MEEEMYMEVCLSNDKRHLREFILLLKTLPEVWDPANVDRHNRAKREKAFKQLLEIYKRIKPEATIKDVNAKINSLKSNYRKEYKKVILKQSTGVKDVDIPKSWVFHMLRFLDKNAKPIDMNTIYLDESKIKIHSESSFSSMDEPAPAPPPPKKLKKNRPVAEQTDLLQKACHRPETPTMMNIDPAALYWTQKLCKLNPTQRVFAEKAINDVLLEAELGTLTRDSVQINVERPEILFVGSPTNSE